ncbi:protein GRAVITROPIC IN THE LIGHT 1 [Diospyros lotus]|uniref:protein GRAVITROPIC IN THE LIGHT 1 n=1 Tax=Diospyros lotus TaxID=55363 RepID=UPI00224FAEF4|nr:protein GRAVITROPIC IN THE LIGHT 1 [Diospyros lotus]XP_052199588.1 protein GRAVITROPIC IN THE LIGHT 1 [Diospyros lotus]XP_052199596.1 protein GRAVITROPIC IN THE LIGHT 1 [Diospyros lotus]XP_052199601.1 protein GRAVITROPIC IN THE LIGHT 1 [Diospyros lotus]XP_052199609.1 protein GRAVITROPIC IN THE LIGHT 1 [Diospyros lotus]XP_052199619.1 protein GRAVITROPIC IN THE LIGHT 1 [Diospyros lotus]
MECATKPSSKPSSNISDVVSKFAKVCRFRSLGVFSSDNPNQPNNDDVANREPLAEDSSDVTEEAECDPEKVHPHPDEIQPKSSETTDFVNIEVSKLFDQISALKLAYVKLQEAHIPYEPDKIRAADELVVTQLQELCKIKCAYKGKQFKEVYPTSALLVAKIRVHERLLEKLKFLVKIKNNQIHDLRQELQDLDLKNRVLVEESRQPPTRNENIEIFNMSSFEDIFKSTSKAIHDFAKPLITLMKASGWDLDRAAESIEASVVYSTRSHKKYAFEAYITRRMFYEMPLESYNVDDILRFDDPINALIEDPYSSFATFCRTKYLSLIHPLMEVSFFRNLDHRAFVTSGRHPRTLFYQAFVKMARWVWVLQGIATSSEPKAEIYVVNRGSEFMDVYMESVEELNEETIVSDGGRSRFKVELMVMPGFRFGETVFRSRVYLSTTSCCRC